MSTLAAEALVASTGIFPTGPVRRVHGQAAQSLPREWARQVRDFFDSSDYHRFKLYPRPDHRRTLDRLSAGLDPDESAELVIDLTPDIAQAYLLQLSNAREYVRSVWPALSQDTPTGPRLLEPGFVSMSEAWSVLAVVNDPSRILTEMMMGTLTDAQVQAFGTVCPALLDMLKSQIQEELIRRVAAKKSWSCPWSRERVLRVLLQMPPDATVSQVSQAPAKTASPDLDIDFKGQATKGQRLEQ